MVNLAASVTGIECATPARGRVRELRLIAAHKPRYNRRSRHPEKVHWLKLTVEPWPRLSLVRKVAEDGADYLGPFASRRTAEKCLAALHEAFPIRQCSDRLPITPTRSPCVLAEMGRCLSPCDGSVAIDDYAALVADGAREPARTAPTRWSTRSPPGWTGSPSDERFEEAGVHRDRLVGVRAGGVAHPAARARCPRAPSWWPPVARTTAGGRSTSCATAGWPPPA